VTTFKLVKQLRDEIADVRAAVDGLDHALGVLLRETFEARRCDAIDSVRIKHLHDDLAQRKKRRKAKA
jgi:hypothetical protein